MTGTTVGRYEVLEKLGEGGMGVVYRARDLTLNRFAALKFLPADSAMDEERKRRFLHEAQVASALNHPNIVTIYEIVLDPPHQFIAMEYVPGRPLEALLSPNGLGLRDVLTYAAQVADALAAAHAAGIVHRDIKPGNVIITEAGVAKVLDFGLAKAVERKAAVVDDITRTVAMGSSPRTVEGSIIGTVAYMSPEQAEGKPIDHRSDIFSFGAMLYETITGKRAFEGDTPVSTLAAILRADAPELAADVTQIPSEVKRIVRRCLEKSPERRWQSIADIRTMLEDARQDLDSPAHQAHRGPARRARLPGWIWPIVAVAVVVIASLALWRSRAADDASEPYTFHRMTSDAASNVSPTISPDGKLIAYSSDRAQSGGTDIWVQQIAGGEAVRLTANLGLCHSPSFSADGSRIVFHGGSDARGIYVMSTFGGEARRVADGRGPQFSPDGAQISYMGPTNDRIVIVSSMGGTPREIPVKHNVVDRARWLPDGKRLLFLGVDATTQSTDWYTVPVEGGEEKSCGGAKWLRDPFTNATPYSVTANAAFINVSQIDAVNLYRVPFDAVQGRITGPPTPVSMAPGINFWPSASADESKIAFGNAPSYDTNLWEMTVDPTNGVVTGEQQLTRGLVDRSAPYPSPGGDRIIYKASAGRTQEIRVLEVASGRETRLVETTDATPPVLSDDGAQVAYAVPEKDGLSTYTVPAEGGVPRRLCSACGRPIQWIARGARILYDKAAKHTEIGVLDVATGKTTTILRASGKRIYTPRLSPDQRVLSFTATTGGRDFKLYTVPFSDSRVIPEEEWRPVMQSAMPNEREAVWSPDGRLLYFLSERDGFRCVWAVRFDPAASKGVGEPFAAYHLHVYRHSLLDFSDVADVGLSMAGRKMFLAVRDIRANIWLAERKTPR